MSTSLSTRALPRRAFLGRGGHLAVALAAVLLFSACTAVAPGNDPIVVNAERGLRAADAIYAESMAYYFRPGVAPTLGKDAVVILEKVRTGFDVPYKATQGALDTYKIVRTSVAAAQIIREQNALAAVLNPAVPIVPAKLTPVEVTP